MEKEKLFNEYIDTVLPISEQDKVDVKAYFNELYERGKQGEPMPTLYSDYYPVNEKEQKIYMEGQKAGNHYNPLNKEVHKWQRKQ